MEYIFYVVPHFEVCQEEWVIKHMKYKKLDVNTLKKYMEAVVKVIEKRAFVCILDTFVLNFDGGLTKRHISLQFTQHNHTPKQ